LTLCPGRRSTQPFFAFDNTSFTVLQHKKFILLVMSHVNVAL